MEITFTSKITLRLIDKMGGDHYPVAAARASTSGEAALEYAVPEKSAENEGLIRYLMSHRHGTPSEHSALTMFLHAPAMVWWEWVRHRVGKSITCPGLDDDTPDMSFNLESGRYRKLDPVFWVPSRERKMWPALDHKPARPRFVPVDDATYQEVVSIMQQAYLASWNAYDAMRRVKGIANEVARAVLGFGVYYSGWITCNPRSLMSFLSLRTHDPEAKFVSYPQAEIEDAARQAEEFLKDGWPISYRAFCEKGRVAP